MIVSLRGTHGSGKSEVVRQLIARYPTKPESVNAKGRPNNYIIDLHNSNKLYVVGQYETPCGGCDSIQPYSEIWPRVVKFAKLGHVLFEGALVSSSYGHIGRDSEEYGEEFVFAFLNTPLEVCLERIKKRREARGNFKPLDPKNTEYKYNNINKSIAKIRDEFNRKVVIIDYRKPVAQILKLIHHGL